MKKLIVLLASALCLLLAACGIGSVLGDKVDVEVNTVDGLYLELAPGYTDRRAAVTVTSENYKRYSSDCSYDIQFFDDGNWYSINSKAESETERLVQIFKRGRSESINCVWDNSLGQLDEGHYRIVITFYEGMIPGKNEPIYLADEFDIGHEHFTEALYVKDDAPAVTVISGDQTIVPYSHFNYSYDFEVFADGVPVAYTLQERSSELPYCVYSEELEMRFSRSTEFRNIVVYSDKYEEIGSYESFAELSELPAGDYFVGIHTVTYGEYSEELNEFAYLGLTGFFRMGKHE